MKQFIPYQGIYVVARQYQGRTAVTIINGTRKNVVMDAKRYVELTRGNRKAGQALDIPTQERYDLTKDLPLKPRQVLVLEY